MKTSIGAVNKVSEKLQLNQLSHPWTTIRIRKIGTHIACTRLKNWKHLLLILLVEAKAIKLTHIKSIIPVTPGVVVNKSSQ